MTTYNEAQTFCEIEKFIKDVVDDQISCEQFKQQIVPLIIKSRRFLLLVMTMLIPSLFLSRLNEPCFKPINIDCMKILKTYLIM
jgi:hypothetical protein